MKIVAQRAYAYLLGMYLGDGHIALRGRSLELRVYCDAAYPGMVEEVETAIRQVRPTANVFATDRPHARCRLVVSGWKEWPRLFPQHGPGRKCDRRIVLDDWQREVTSTEPRALVRGLIHSDGCRFIARQRSRGRVRMRSRWIGGRRSRSSKRSSGRSGDRRRGGSSGGWLARVIKVLLVLVAVVFVASIGTAGLVIHHDRHRGDDGGSRLDPPKGDAEVRAGRVALRLAAALQDRDVARACSMAAGAAARKLHCAMISVGMRPPRGLRLEAADTPGARVRGAIAIGIPIGPPTGRLDVEVDGAGRVVYLNGYT